MSNLDQTVIEWIRTLRPIRYERNGTERVDPSDGVTIRPVFVGLVLGDYTLEENDYAVTVDVRDVRVLSADPEQILRCVAWVSVYGGTTWPRSTVWNNLSDLVWDLFSACKSNVRFDLVDAESSWEATIVGIQPLGVLRSNMDDRSDRGMPPMRMFNVELTVQVV